MCTCVKCLSFVPFFFVLPYFCIFLVRQNCCIYLKFTFHFYGSFPFFLPLRYDYCVQDIYIVLKTTRKLLALYTCVLSGTSLTILPPRTKMGFYFIDRARFLCGLRSSDLMVRSFGFVSLTKALKSGLETKKNENSSLSSDSFRSANGFISSFAQSHSTSAPEYHERKPIICTARWLLQGTQWSHHL